MQSGTECRNALFELALIETVGTAAAAPEASIGIATKVKSRTGKGLKNFISSHDVHSSRFALWREVFPMGKSPPRAETEDGQRQRRLMQSAT
jgi:hypothetical protein